MSALLLRAHESSVFVLPAFCPPTNRWAAAFSLRCGTRTPAASKSCSRCCVDLILCPCRIRLVLFACSAPVARLLFVLGPILLSACCCNSLICGFCLCVQLFIERLNRMLRFGTTLIEAKSGNRLCIACVPSPFSCALAVQSCDFLAQLLLCRAVLSVLYYPRPSSLHTDLIETDLRPPFVQGTVWIWSTRSRCSRFVRYCSLVLCCASQFLLRLMRRLDLLVAIWSRRVLCSALTQTQVIHDTKRLTLLFDIVMPQIR